MTDAKTTVDDDKRVEEDMAVTAPVEVTRVAEDMETKAARSHVQAVATQAAATTTMTVRL